MSETLDYLEDERVLAIRYETTDYSRPIKTTLWWPILRATKSESLIYALGAPMRHLGEGAYRYDDFRAEVPEAARRLVFHLSEGGRTKAIKCLEEPIPCPKVRQGVEVQWNRGRWEKYQTEHLVSAIFYVNAKPRSVAHVRR